MSNIINEIKTIIFNLIEKEYSKYLSSNNILMIKENKIIDIVTNFYETKNKLMKNEIRASLKEKYKENYPNATVENIILDIFQDKEININKIKDELIFIQKKNYNSLEIPIINNSLNINISIVDNYIVINSTNAKNIEDPDKLYLTIDKYKFLYSINDKILEEYADKEKINIIKSEIKNKNNVKIGVYYLKNC